MRTLVVAAAAAALLGFTVAAQAQTGMGQGGMGQGGMDLGGMNQGGMSNGGMMHHKRKISHKHMMMMKKKHPMNGDDKM